MTELYYGDLKDGETTSDIYRYENHEYEASITFSNGYLEVGIINLERCVGSFTCNSTYDLKNANLFLEKYGFTAKKERARWRANGGGTYYRINDIGNIVYEREEFGDVDTARYRILNYFKTKDEAYESPIYKVYNRVFDINFDLSFG